jgi:hypothetical protein
VDKAPATVLLNLHSHLADTMASNTPYSTRLQQLGQGDVMMSCHMQDALPDGDQVNVPIRQICDRFTSPERGFDILYIIYNNI